MTDRIGPFPWLVGYCRAQGCGVPMISQPRAAKLARAAYDGWGVHEGHGYCSPHYYRFKRYGDPLGTPPPTPARPPVTITTCAGEECSARVADPRRLAEARRLEADVVANKARGLCRRCYNAHYKAAKRAGEFERINRSYDDTLDEWVMLRDNGTTSMAEASRRMGMGQRALEQALYRARKRGDIRGSLVAYSHDMRSAA